MNYVNYLDTLQRAAKLSNEGKKEEALSSYLTSIELAVNEEDKLEPLYAIGIELKDINAEDAVNYFEQCSKIAASYDRSSFYYSYFYNSERELGEIFMHEKCFPKALLHFKKAYKEIASLNDDPETEDYLNQVIKVMEKKSA